jgi:hypothetical protein
MMKIVALIGALAVVAHASVYVSPTGDDTTGTGTKDRPYRTVRYAHDKIDTTGVIYLMPGAYTGSENMFELQKSLTISGAPGEDPATIWFDGLNVNNGPIFTFSIVKGALVANFINVGFRKHKNAGFNMGIVHILSATATFSNCRFEDNDRSVTITGHPGVAHFTNVQCVNNGECISVPYADFGNTATIVINNVTVTGKNTGSGLSISSGPTTVTGSGFHASYLAFGFDLTTSDKDFDIKMTNVKLDHSLRGIYAYGMFDGKPAKGRISLNGGSISHNALSRSTDNGAGILLGRNIIVDLTDIEITNNTVTAMGGGWSCKDQGTLNLNSLTVEYNRAPDGAAGSCDAGCAFVASKVVARDNVEDKNTKRCSGI